MITPTENTKMVIPTTIMIDNETREELKNIGRKGQTYRDVILQLLAQYKSSKNNNNLVSTPPRTENQTVAIVGVR